MSFPSFSLSQEDVSYSLEDFISVEFNNAPLTDILILVAEKTGSSFIVNSPDDIHLAWIQNNIHLKNLLHSFKLSLLSSGFTFNKIDNYANFYSISKSSFVSPVSEKSLGFYKLKNISSDSLVDTSEVLYGNRLLINVLENTNTVIFSGSYELVQQFINLLSQIDVPRDVDISSFRLKHISVSTALKALSDTKLLPENNFFADYWNRSVIVKGSQYHLDVAHTILKSIDLPQKGRIDRVEYIFNSEFDLVSELLVNSVPGIEVRKISDKKLFISGHESDVDRASVLLHKIDGSNQQVKVEAIIAYLTDRQFKELGTKLTFKKDNNRASLNSNLISTLTASNTGILLDFFQDTLGITFAAEDGTANGKLLSSPVLTVLNNQKASIHVGQNVPYLSKANFNNDENGSTPTSIERKDLGLTFSVTPMIYESGEFVRLNVSQIVSNINDDSELSRDAVDITFDKKQINSTVLVANGDTIFLGGLRSEERGSATDYIPFLGELPVVGKLFSYETEQLQNRHLIVALRVNVIDSDV